MPGLTICPSCRESTRADQRFCEKCGGTLGEVAPPPAVISPFSGAAPPRKIPLAAKRRRPGLRGKLAAGGNYLRRQEESAQKSVRTASIYMAIVAGLTLIAGIWGLSQFDGEIAKLRANPLIVINEEIVGQFHLLYYAYFGMSAVFAGLAVWASASPYAATVTGLILYLTMIVISAVLNPITLLQGWLLKGLAIGALIQGIRAGLKLGHLKALRRRAR